MVGCICCVLVCIILYGALAATYLVSTPRQHRRRQSITPKRLEEPNLFNDLGNLRWEDMRYRVGRLRFKVDALSTYISQHINALPPRKQSVIIPYPTNLTCATAAAFLAAARAEKLQKQHVKAYRNYCMSCELSDRSNVTRLSQTWKKAVAPISKVKLHRLFPAVRGRESGMGQAPEDTVLAIGLLANINEFPRVKSLAAELQVYAPRALLCVILMVCTSKLQVDTAQRAFERYFQAAEGPIVRLLLSPQRNVSSSMLINYAMAYAYNKERADYFTVINGDTKPNVRLLLQGARRIQRERGIGVAYEMQGSNKVIQVTASRLHISQHRLFLPVDGGLDVILRWIVLLYAYDAYALSEVRLDVGLALREQSQETAGCEMWEYLFHIQSGADPV